MLFSDTLTVHILLDINMMNYFEFRLKNILKTYQLRINLDDTNLTQ